MQYSEWGQQVTMRRKTKDMVYLYSYVRTGAQQTTMKALLVPTELKFLAFQPRMFENDFLQS